MAMNIIPISAHPAQTSSVPGVENAKSASNLPFKDMFETALKNIDEADAQKAQDTIALAMGEVDDLAAIANNSLKAEVALQLLVQLRNKALDGYQELMRINV